MTLRWPKSIIRVVTLKKQKADRKLNHCADSLDTWINPVTRLQPSAVKRLNTWSETEEQKQVIDGAPSCYLKVSLFDTVRNAGHWILFLFDLGYTESQYLFVSFL